MRISEVVRSARRGAWATITDSSEAVMEWGLSKRPTNGEGYPARGSVVRKGFLK